MKKTHHHNEQGHGALLLQWKGGNMPKGRIALVSLINCNRALIQQYTNKIVSHLNVRVLKYSLFSNYQLLHEFSRPPPSQQHLPSDEQSKQEKDLCNSKLNLIRVSSFVTFDITHKSDSI